MILSSLSLILRERCSPPTHPIPTSGAVSTRAGYPAPWHAQSRPWPPAVLQTLDPGKTDERDTQPLSVDQVDQREHFLPGGKHFIEEV